MDNGRYDLQPHAPHLQTVPARRAFDVAKRGVLEHPSVRVDLIRELAEGKATHGELAEKYGVARQSIDEFAQRHALRIAEVRQNAADEYAGIWIADKRKRVEELRSHVDYCRELLDDPDRQARVNVGTAEILRAAQSALHAASEELGQLPARGVKHEGGVSVRYVIEGVDPDAYA
jgi:Trp operon repressor